MSLIMRILCRLGLHMRSRRKARRTETGWKSECRNCGKPMLKVKGGDWRIAMRAEPAPVDKRKMREMAARQRRTPPPPRRRPPSER